MSTRYTQGQSVAIKSLAKKGNMVVSGTGLLPDNFTDGFIVGLIDSYPNKEKYCVAAATMNYAFITGHGIERDPNTEAEGAYRKVGTDPQYYSTANMRGGIIQTIDFNKKAIDINDTFAVNTQQIAELQIDNIEQLDQLCYFAANCYQQAPNVITEMQNGDFRKFQEYRSQSAVAKALARENAARPININLIIK